MIVVGFDRCSVLVIMVFDMCNLFGFIVFGIGSCVVGMGCIVFVVGMDGCMMVIIVIDWFGYIKLVFHIGWTWMFGYNVG